jgi:hypothetical protein
MKRVAANWSEPRRPPWWAWLPVLALAIAAAFFGARAFQLRQELAAAQQRLKQAQEAASAKPTPVALAPAAPPYEASARQFLQERQAIWPQALHALEKVQLPGLVVQTVDFNARDGSFGVEVIAPDHATVAKLVRELNVGQTGAAGELVWALQRSQAGAEAGQVRAQLRCSANRP